jgi:hypothetical protein
MMQEPQDHAARLTISDVSGTERTFKLKLERKEQPSDLEAIPFRTSEERRIAVVLSLDFWNEYLKKLDEVIRGIHDQFVRFGRAVANDLVDLAHEGANPNVIINILATVWFEKHSDDERLKAGRLSSSQEIRRLSSTDYWVNGKRRLQRADKFLSSLMSYLWVGISIRGHSGGREDNPFNRVCRDAADAKEKIVKLVKTIDELSLCRDGWMWRPAWDGVKLVETGRRGVKRSGRGRAGEKGLHWGLCATELHFYLKRRTAKPHWGTIARLLRLAGFVREFPRLIPRDGERLRDPDLVATRWNYKDRIKKRVVALWKEYGTRYTVTDEYHYIVHCS